MVEEGIRGGICHSIHRYAKANNKYMKDYDKIKKSSYVQYLDANNLYGWAMSQKLPVNDFKWIKNTSKIDEKFIKITMRIIRFTHKIVKTSLRLRIKIRKDS